MQDLLRKVLSLESFVSEIFWSAVLAGLIGIFRWATGQPLERKKHWAFVATCFILAFILVSAFKQVRANQGVDQPKLSMRPAGFIVGKNSEKSNMPPQIIFRLEIVNNGSPSIVRDWSLEIILPTKEILRPPPLIEHPARIFNYIILDGEKKEVILTPDEWLPRKLAEMPIPRGSSARGHVIFLAKDIPEKILDSPGVLYRLSARDVEDKAISTDLVVPFERPK